MLTQFERNQLKTDVQNEAVENYSPDKDQLFDWATGTGKSVVGLRCILKHRSKYPDQVWVIMVWAVSHKANWRREIEKWAPELAGIRIECYHSSKKIKNDANTLGIKVNFLFDEGHHSTSVSTIEDLRSIKNHAIYLSGSIGDCEGAIRKFYGKYIKSTITLMSAINMGLLPKPKINVYFRDPSKGKGEFIYIKSKGGSKIKASDNLDFTHSDWSKIKTRDLPKIYKAHIKCTEIQQNSMVDADINKYRWLVNSGKKFAGIHLQRFMGNRIAILANSKTTAVRWLLDNKVTRKSIVFCGSILQANELGSHNDTYHSKSNAENRKAIDNFNDGTISTLYAVSAVNEGENLSGIEECIITQLASSEREIIQRLGRVVRGESPIVSIIVNRGTYDEHYYNKFRDLIPLPVNEIEYEGVY